MKVNLPTLVSVLTAALILASCTPGQTEFSCKGYPDGVACISAREVYDLTNSRSRVTQADLENAPGGGGSAVDDVLKPLPNADPRLNLAPPTKASQQAADPAAGVMRIWVGPHVTSAGDVAAPNYVYSRIGNKRVNAPLGIERRFEPLTGQSRPGPAVDARPLAAGDMTVAKSATLAGKSVNVADIYFENGRADVSASGRHKLEAAARKIAELQPKSLMVAGFTDTLGSKEANKKLAKRRADAVTGILRELGVTTKILDTTKADVKTLGKAPAAVADPNKRRVWVVALDVKPQSTTVAKAAAVKISTSAPGPLKGKIPTAGTTGSSSRDSGYQRPCRLCRDLDDDDDDDGRSDHDGQDHGNGNGMHN